MENVKGFEIVKSVDAYDSLIKYRTKGALRGKYLGFPQFHKNYTMSLPGVTDWTGFPQSGKTQVLMEFLLNTSEWYGWKHLVYFPDVGDRDEILADLIHKRTGKTFDKRFPNHISESEISQNLDWICEHFIILTKVDLKAKMSPVQFWDYGVELSKVTQGGIQTMSVDSWKDLNHDTQGFGRDDKYLEYVLSYRNGISEKYKMHIHTIIHPLKTDKDKDGIRKPPGPYDLKGGTEWFNNGKNMITVHRPEGGNNAVDLFITKIKPTSVGSRGEYRMYFDRFKSRYYYWLNSEKSFANQLSKEEVEELEQKLVDGDLDTTEANEVQEKISSVTNEPDDLPF